MAKGEEVLYQKVNPFDDDDDDDLLYAYASLS